MFFQLFVVTLHYHKYVKMKKIFLITILLIVFVANVFVACTDEEKYSSSSSIKLQFSSDTISFDTIFTTIGSTTKQVRIFNPENEAIKLDYITLANGHSSYFRLNADGDTSLVAKDITIGAKDSIFVFVRVELDINNQTNPLLIEDSIIIAFNGKQQSILLMAYGQDAYYHKPTHILQSGESGIPYSLANEGGDASGVIVSGNNIMWKTDKPHVILGICVVDSAFTLALTDNTLIYMGNNSDFWVYTGGTLKANGTNSSPVVFQSLRTQDRYANIPGQWGKIWFWAGSKDNVLDNVKIKNATIGMVADTCVNNNHTVAMNNVFIENCSQIGLYARGTDIYATNLIVQNCGSYCVALTIGGSYEFIGCTFANYWSYDATKNKPVLLLNDWYEANDGSIQARKIDKSDFHNTIIYGSSTDSEIEFDLLEGLNSNYSFNYCLIKTDAITNNNSNVRNCIFNKDPMFVNIAERDVHVENSSPAIGMANGIYNAIIPYDIYGVLRLNQPTIGAVENRNRVDNRR